MEYVIKSLTPDLAEDYFDFFDNRAFSDGSPFYPCYCNAFNLSKERMEKELYQRAEDYGNGLEGWIRALRESAERMVQAGEIKGYLAYDNGIAIGWCNSNDRMSYYRTGEFDLHTLSTTTGKAKKLPVEPWSRDIQEKALPWQPNFRHSILCRRSR